MLSDWLWFFALSAIVVAVQSLPAGLGDEAKKTEQTSRPKVKRSQELLMFGNQQNRQASENTAANNFSPSVEKRTLSNSGLEDVSAVLADAEQEANRPKALPSRYAVDQPGLSPQHEKNYEYGMVMLNELDDVLPRGPWDLSNAAPAAPAPYYFGLRRPEERRKRSEVSSPSPASNVASSSAAAAASANAATAPVSTAQPPAPGPVAQQPQAAAPANFQPLVSQPKRSVLSYYQEPRYKRESDVDPDKLYALLSLYDSERRNRGNWRNYGNEEYENVDDDSNIIGLDDEDPSGSSWLDSYPQQQQHHYLAAEPLLSSELAALGHAGRPLGYYDQYLSQQQPQPQQQQYGTGASGSSQYDAAVQYGVAQYGVPYGVQHAYYPPEKRFMVSRKRSQNYDSYGGRSGLLLNSRGYPSYQHRLLY